MDPTGNNQTISFECLALGLLWNTLNITNMVAEHHDLREEATEGNWGVLKQLQEMVSTDSGFVAICGH